MFTSFINGHRITFKSKLSKNYSSYIDLLNPIANRFSYFFDFREIQWKTDLNTTKEACTSESSQELRNNALNQEPMLWIERTSELSLADTDQDHLFNTLKHDNTNTKQDLELLMFLLLKPDKSHAMCLSLIPSKSPI